MLLRNGMRVFLIRNMQIIFYLYIWILILIIPKKIYFIPLVVKKSYEQKFISRYFSQVLNESVTV